MDPSLRYVQIDVGVSVMFCASGFMPRIHQRLVSDCAGVLFVLAKWSQTLTSVSIRFPEFHWKLMETSVFPGKYSYRHLSLDKPWSLTDISVWAVNLCAVWGIFCLPSNSFQHSFFLDFVAKNVLNKYIWIEKKHGCFFPSQGISPNLKSSSYDGYNLPAWCSVSNHSLRQSFI